MRSQLRASIRDRQSNVSASRSGSCGRTASSSSVAYGAGFNRPYATPRFASNAQRVRHRDLLVGLITEKLAAKTAREWLALLEPSGVPVGPINNLEQVFADPQVRHRGMEVRAPHAAAGEVTMVASPMRFSRTPIRYEHGPPVLGQHTAEVLRSVLGLDAGRIEQLRKEGIV